MIEDVTMHSLSCDNCKVEYEEKHIGFSAFYSVSSAEEYAENDGWYRDDNSNGTTYHYCPDCWETDEEDNLIVNELRKAN